MDQVEGEDDNNDSEPDFMTEYNLDVKVKNLVNSFTKSLNKIQKETTEMFLSP